MKNQFYPLVLLTFILCSMQFLQAQKGDGNHSILSKKEVDKHIIQQIVKTGEAYDWNTAPSELIHSALVHVDSIAFVGYKPADLATVSVEDFRGKLNSDRWESARVKILNTITDWDQKGSHKDGRKIKSVLFERFPELPFMGVKIYDQALIEHLRQMPECRFLEVPSYGLGQQYKSNESPCGGDSEPVETIKTEPYGIYTAGWHHYDNTITQAWDQGYKGDDIKVVLLDTGIEKLHPQYQADVWNSGGSLGREPLDTASMHLKVEDYMTDEWMENLSQDMATADDINQWLDSQQSLFDYVNDDCGHGTALASVIAGPLTTSGFTCGTAPRADLAVYRVTNDMIINEWEEHIGVAAGILKATADLDVKILSMSLGTPLRTDVIGDALKIAVNRGIIPFCAGGTLPEFLILTGEELAEMDLSDEDISLVVAFPASMRETVAVTGMRFDPADPEASPICNTCFGGDKIDFSIYMEKVFGSESYYVPSYAFTNDTEPFPMRAFGGSSSATGNLAGIAALIWSADPDASAGTILNALVAGATIPSNMEKDHIKGRKNINVPLAISHLPRRDYDINTFQEATLRVTKMEFPSVVEWSVIPNTFAEWAIELNNKEHYAKVKQGSFASPIGTDAQEFTGPPLSFIKNNAYDSDGPLIEFPMGTFLANEFYAPGKISYSIQEDDVSGFFIVDSGPIQDDMIAVGELFIDLSENTGSFDIPLPEGNTITVWYELNYRPIFSDEPSLNIEQTCAGQTPAIEAFPPFANEYTFFVDLNEDSYPDPIEILQQGAYNTAEPFTNAFDNLSNGDVLSVHISGDSFSGYASTIVTTYPLPTISINPSPDNPFEYTFEINTPFACYTDYNYGWNFGNGFTTLGTVPWGEDISWVDDEGLTGGTVENGTHLYTEPGLNVVELVIYSPDNMEEIGTISVVIDVNNLQDFSCFSEEAYTLENFFEITRNHATKTVTVTPVQDENLDIFQFTYDWGDGSDPESVVGPVPVPYTYSSSGNYDLVVTIEDLSDPNCRYTHTEVIKILRKLGDLDAYVVDFEQVLEFVGNPIRPISNGGGVKLTLSGDGPSIIEDLDIETTGQTYTQAEDELTVKGGASGGGSKPYTDNQAGNKMGQNSLNLAHISAMPNPAQNGKANIVCDNNHTIRSLQVYSADGRLLEHHEDIQQSSFSLNNLPKGMLFVKAQLEHKLDKKAETQTIRLVVTD